MPDPQKKWFPGPKNENVSRYIREMNLRLARWVEWSKSQPKILTCGILPKKVSVQKHWCWCLMEFWPPCNFLLSGIHCFWNTKCWHDCLQDEVSLLPIVRDDEQSCHGAKNIPISAHLPAIKAVMYVHLIRSVSSQNSWAVTVKFYVNPFKRKILR